MELSNLPNDPRLDLAYRYPFLKEAKELVSELGLGFDHKLLEAGRLRLEAALSESRMGFHSANLRDLKYAYLMSYIYARMLVSALGSRSLIARYADAESRRAAAALRAESDENLMRVAEELDSRISALDSLFSIRFERYLKCMPESKSFSLSMQELGNGYVRINRNTAIGLLRVMIKREVAKGLPIPKKELPSEAISYSEKVRFRETTERPALPGSEKRYAWIEKLLSTPIPDVRHRVVNLILAPYLTNIRKLAEEEAAATIINYIERCKELEPNTRINESYIRYQCRYSKRKGMRPLSFEKAKELLGSMIEIDMGVSK